MGEWSDWCEMREFAKQEAARRSQHTLNNPRRKDESLTDWIIRLNKTEK